MSHKRTLLTALDFSRFQLFDRYETTNSRNRLTKRPRRKTEDRILAQERPTGPRVVFVGCGIAG